MQKKQFTAATTLWRQSVNTPQVYKYVLEESSGHLQLDLMPTQLKYMYERVSHYGV